jgi:hypothetical protein
LDNEKDFDMMITRELIDSLEFRKFEKNDYYGFAGVTSPIPLIADRDDGIIMIIDGAYAELYVTESDGSVDLADSVDNINELSYKTEKQLKIEAAIEAAKEQIDELQYTIEMLSEQLN